MYKYNKMNILQKPTHSQFDKLLLKNRHDDIKLMADNDINKWINGINDKELVISKALDAVVYAMGEVVGEVEVVKTAKKKLRKVLSSFEDELIFVNKDLSVLNKILRTRKFNKLFTNKYLSNIIFNQKKNILYQDHIDGFI